MMNLVYNIEFDIAAVIIEVIILVILNTIYTKTKTNLLFQRFLITSLISCTLDIVTAITISFALNIPPLVNVILNSVYLLSASFAAYFIYLYVYYVINYAPKIDMILSKIILYAYMALLIINGFTGIVFDFKGGSYNRGPLFLINFFVPLYLTIHLLYLMIFKKFVFTFKQQVYNNVIVLLPFAATIFQIFFPSYLLTSFSYSLVAFIMLFSLETPDFEELEYLRSNLEKEVKKQTTKAHERQMKIQKLSMEIVEALAEAIDAKDNYTNGHSLRVARYSVLLANELGWDPEKMESLRCAALLHDVGKIGVPDNVLLKPMNLTDDEYETIKSHTIQGGEILESLSSLPDAFDVAKYHHENYDGSGYPEHLKGEEIPEFARIVSIADSFDAMNTKRIYRDALPREEIRERLIKGRGTQFDPNYLDRFLVLFDMEMI